MEPRIDPNIAAPGARAAMYGLEKYVRESGLEKALLELVRLRASQMNGCAYCIDMHSKDARAEGESEQRLYGLTAWRETPFYNDRERAALEWTEAVTAIGEAGVPDELYSATSKHFTETELVNLTMAVVAINGWTGWRFPFERFREVIRGSKGPGCFRSTGRASSKL